MIEDVVYSTINSIPDNIQNGVGLFNVSINEIELHIKLVLSMAIVIIVKAVKITIV